jgi:predicted secreted protein
MRCLGIYVLVLLSLAAPIAAAEQSVDVRNGPVIDPTKNVLDALANAVGRLDDLRKASDAINDLRYVHMKELLAAEAARADNEAKLRAEYADRLSMAEAKRIDAIRAVDVSAVQATSSKAQDQAVALQTQVNQSAEVLRNQVARSAEDLRALVSTTAAAALQSQQQQFTALSTRITTLEQAGAEGLGKQKFQDPAIAALVEEVRKLGKSQSDNAATTSGRGDVVGWIVAAIAILINGGMLFFVMRRQTTRARH